VKDEEGNVIELKCTYDPATRGGHTTDGRVVKGTIHWVSAPHSLPCELRLYDRLFRVQDPEQGDDFKEFLNPESLVIVEDARIEPAVGSDEPGSRYQFERVGYFCSDRVHSKPGALVFNRTVTLRDSWARQLAGAPSEGRPDRGRGGKHPEEGERGRGGGKHPEEGKRGREAEAGVTAKAGAKTKPRTGAGVGRSAAEIIAADARLARLFEDATAVSERRDAIANYVVNELPREMKDKTLEELRFGGRELAELVELIEGEVITAVAGREVLAVLAAEGGDPRAIVERKGLRQITDAATLDPIMDSVVAANPDKVAAYRAGRAGLLGFFVGQVMERTRGRANPEQVKRGLEQRLTG
jgi:glutaminyl-tRNA synthetase